MVGQTNFPGVKMYIPRPRQTEYFTTAAARKIQGQQHNQVLPFCLLQHFHHVAFRRNVAVFLFGRKFFDRTEEAYCLREVVYELRAPVPSRQQVFSVLVGDACAFILFRFDALFFGLLRFSLFLPSRTPARNL